MRIKREELLGYFGQAWEGLFSSPMHLDSILSRLPREVKPRIAPWIARILLRPFSEARGSGIELSPGEPWDLSLEERAHWQGAREIVRNWWECEAEGLPLPRVPHSCRADFPKEILQEWEADWGPRRTEELVTILGGDPPLSLRASASVGPKRVLEELLSEKSLPTSAEVSPLVPFGIRIRSYASILNTEVFRSGKFEIQDEGSQLMALFALWPEKMSGLLQSEPGRVLRTLKDVGWTELPDSGPVGGAPSVVIDACAGAGGKTLAMSDALRGKGRIFAYDTSARKLDALKRRCARAGLRNVQIAVIPKGGEDEKLSSFKTLADVVLVDAPCSGWGVLRRNPDIKWRQHAEITEIQLRLLSVYSRMVKKGGRLVFGVCTQRKKETLDVVDCFLRDHPSYQRGPGGYFGPGPTDGFFMQCLNRVE